MAEWLAGVVLAFSLSAAGRPQEVLPPPRETPRLRIDHLRPIHPFYDADPYWRMRLYAADRYGQLRPRVIYGPCGAYYPLTGEPYPFTPVRGIP